MFDNFTIMKYQSRNKATKETEKDERVKKVLQGLLVAPAQEKAGKTSDNLLN